jgi:predicted nucleotidyltransferase
MLTSITGSKTRSEIFRVLFDGQKKEYYLRALGKICGCSLTALQNELKNLVVIDLVKARKDGNRIYYSANENHPLYLDLISIVEKTVGVIGQLQTRLKDNRIEYALIFGSFARGEEKGESDIDILVVGNISMRELTKLLSGIQEKINREINPHIYSKNDFVSKMKKKDHFLLNIMKSEKKKIIGNIDELERIHR